MARHNNSSVDVIDYQDSSFERHTQIETETYFYLYGNVTLTSSDWERVIISIRQKGDEKKVTAHANDITLADKVKLIYDG